MHGSSHREDQAMSLSLVRCRVARPLPGGQVKNLPPAGRWARRGQPRAQSLVRPTVQSLGNQLSLRCAKHSCRQRISDADFTARPSFRYRWPRAESEYSGQFGAAELAVKKPRC